MKTRSRLLALFALSTLLLSTKLFALETASCLSPYLSKDLPTPGELNKEGSIDYSKVSSEGKNKIWVYTQIQAWNESDRIAHLWRTGELKTDYVRKSVEIGKKFYSEKSLSTLNEGKWTVEVRDQEGRILNLLEFSVVKKNGQTLIVPQNQKSLDCHFSTQGQQEITNTEKTNTATEETQKREGNGSAWASFRLESIAVFKGKKSSTNTALLSWRPEYQFNDKMAVGLALGYSLYKQSNGHRFNVFEYALTGTYNIIGPWSAELIAGAQTWMVYDNATKFMMGANAKYTFDKKIFKVFDQVTAGYSTVSQDKNYNILRLGAGIKF